MGLFALGLVGLPEGYLRDVVIRIIVHDGTEEVLGAFGFVIGEDQLQKVVGDCGNSGWGFSGFE